jgi:nucleotide-binding universal stress UspA family protein
MMTPPLGRPRSVQPGRLVMYSHILVPTDGSPLSLAAVRHGVDLAKNTGAKISFLTVTTPYRVMSLGVDQVEDVAGEYAGHMQVRAKNYLAEAAEVARSAGVTSEEIHVQDGHPYRAIIRTAESSGCDLIVMASHGRQGISALLLGSETLKVLTHSTIPVLVCRLPDAYAQEKEEIAARERYAREVAPIYEL